MPSKGATTENDCEEVDVAVVAARLANLSAAPQAEEVEVKKRAFQPPARNVVQDDGVLKERVKNQEKSLKSWEKKWTKVALCEKMFRETMKRIGVDPRPTSLRPCSISLPLAPVNMSPPVPNLSSGVIGWRSTEPKYSLELFGQLYKSPLHTMEPPAQDGDLPRNKQYFIRLG